MRYTLVLLFLLLFSTTAWATHNRAGEITYEHISGTTYRITITTYTKISAPADRPWMPINYGDGSPPDSIARQVPPPQVAFDVQKNVYIKNHTFPGPGNYRLLSEDPNRNADILNLGGPVSVNLVFAIETYLRINPIGGVNNSVQLLNPPLDDGCVYQVFEHNPGAYDPDGDSLSYELVTCLGPSGEPLVQYVDPDQVQPGPNNNISIDPVTGTVVWDSPQQIGFYNIAIKITEFRRNNATGQVVEVGYVLRDMQIDIKQCGNRPPQIEALPDTCVEAGTSINFQVTATDPDGDLVTLTAFGGPLELSSSPATFSQLTVGSSGTFSWNTTCEHVRAAPYQVVFKANDNEPSGSISAFSVMNITVVAPAPQNPNATPDLGAISLSWDQSPCTEATCYKIYRRAGSYGFVPGYCETGVPAYTGFELLTTIDGLENTTYYDDNNIVFGVGYCYMVVACFPDGAQSYASEEFCAEISAEIPLITHNSVGATDNTLGIDTLRWQPPFDLDTINSYLGPYQYNVYRGGGSGSVSELIHTTPESPTLLGTQNQLIVENLNTQSQANTYQVVLVNDGQEASGSNLAASIFLSANPGDTQLNLSWNDTQPWVNFNYEVQRFDMGINDWQTLGNTGEPSYVDSPLVNGETYCYRVIATGSYFNSVFPDTLINYSQELCATPYDNTPPCAPVLSKDCYCESAPVEVEVGVEAVNILTWTNPNTACDDTDDTEMYYIYYAPTDTHELLVIDSVYGAENTSYEINMNGSVAGCYAVSALDYDAVNDRRNESELSEIFCCDNCPVYELPDIFTPNGDGVNDFFVPFPYRFVESIDLIIYNRWGQPVFESTNPDINWDGRHKDSGERVSDGVYFYICTVNTIRLKGAESFKLSGTVNILDGKNVNFK